MGIEFIQTTNDIKILFSTYKAKATNVGLESKAKDSHQGHIAQGQGQTITRPRPQILSLRPRTNITDVLITMDFRPDEAG